MKKEIDLLIIGAGPFGLAMAAQSQHLGIDYLVVGKPMEFWKLNMPEGMYLRSACDWHLDPQNVDTIDCFLQTQGLTTADVEPLSHPFYLSYVQWFQERKQIDVLPVYVQQLNHDREGDYPFHALMEDGQTIRAARVVIAVGFKYFRNIPDSLVDRLPAGHFTHTCDLVEFTALKGKRCFIIGGRQSAFEWTALLNEAGASTVDISYRHDSPAFTEADWSWVNPMVDAIVDAPEWFRNLSAGEKDGINHRLWAEGRLKVEPWLEERVMKESVRLWPHTQLQSCDLLPNGDLEIGLDNGEKLTVDHLILATGYKVEIDQVPFLRQGNILSALTIKNGYPVLDAYFQTNVRGLFITSLAASQDFGPFFGFTIAVRTSAKLIGQGLGRGG